MQQYSMKSVRSHSGSPQLSGSLQFIWNWSFGQVVKISDAVQQSPCGSKCSSYRHRGACLFFSIRSQRSPETVQSVLGAIVGLISR